MSRSGPGAASLWWACLCLIAYAATWDVFQHRVAAASDGLTKTDASVERRLLSSGEGSSPVVSLYVSSSHGSDSSSSCNSSAPCASLVHAAQVVSTLIATETGSNVTGAFLVSVDSGLYSESAAAVFLLRPGSSLTLALASDAVVDGNSQHTCAVFAASGSSTNGTSAAPLVSIRGGVWQRCVNMSASGGAMQFLFGVQATLEQVVLRNNSAWSMGGAVFVDSSSTLTALRDCRSSGNAASWVPTVPGALCAGIVGGGAVGTLQTSGIAIERCVFRGDWTTDAAGGCVTLGGALALPYVSWLAVNDTQFVQCSASSAVRALGGALAAATPSSAALYNITAQGCTAHAHVTGPVALADMSAQGGALYIALDTAATTGGPVTLAQSRFTANSALLTQPSPVPFTYQSGAVHFRAMGGAVVLSAPASLQSNIAPIFASLAVTDSAFDHNSVLMQCAPSPSSATAAAVGGGLCLVVADLANATAPLLTVTRSNFTANSVLQTQVSVAQWLLAGGGGLALLVSPGGGWAQAAVVHATAVRVWSNSVTQTQCVAYAASSAPQNAAAVSSGGGLLISLGDFSAEGSSLAGVAVLALDSRNNSLWADSVQVSVAADPLALASMQAVAVMMARGGGATVSLGCVITCTVQCSNVNLRNSVLYSGAVHVDDRVMLWSPVTSMPTGSNAHALQQALGGGTAIALGDGAYFGVDGQSTSASNSFVVDGGQWIRCRAQLVNGSVSGTAVLRSNTGFLPINVLSAGSLIQRVAGGGLSLSVADAAYYATGGSPSLCNGRNAVLLGGGGGGGGGAGDGTAGSPLWLNCTASLLSSSVTMRAVADSLQFPGSVYQAGMYGLALQSAGGAGLSVSLADHIYYGAGAINAGNGNSITLTSPQAQWIGCVLEAGQSTVTSTALGQTSQFQPQQSNTAFVSGSSLQRIAGAGAALSIGYGVYGVTGVLNSVGTNTVQLLGGRWQACRVWALDLTVAGRAQSTSTTAAQVLGSAAQQVGGGGAAVFVGDAFYASPGAAQWNTFNLVETVGLWMAHCTVQASGLVAQVAAQPLSYVTAAGSAAQLVRGAGLSVSLGSLLYYGGSQTSTGNNAGNTVYVNANVWTACQLQVDNASAALQSGATGAAALLAGGGGVAVSVADAVFATQGASGAQNDGGNQVVLWNTTWDRCAVAVALPAATVALSNDGAVVPAGGSNAGSGPVVQLTCGGCLALSFGDAVANLGSSAAADLNEGRVVNSSLLRCALSVQVGAAGSAAATTAMTSGGAALAVSGHVGLYAPSSAPARPLFSQLVGLNVCDCTTETNGTQITLGTLAFLLGTMAQGSAGSSNASSGSGSTASGGDGSLSSSSFALMGSTVQRSRCHVTAASQQALGCGCGIEFGSGSRQWSAAANVFVVGSALVDHVVSAAQTALAAGAGLGVSFANAVSGAPSALHLYVLLNASLIANCSVESLGGSPIAGAAQLMAGGGFGFVGGLRTATGASIDATLAVVGSQLQRNRAAVVQATAPLSPVAAPAASPLLNEDVAAASAAAGGSLAAIVASIAVQVSVGPATVLADSQASALAAPLAAGSAAVVAVGGAVALLPMDTVTALTFELTNVTLAGNWAAVPAVSAASAAGAASSFGGAMALRALDPTVFNRRFRGTVQSCRLENNRATVDSGSGTASGGAVFTAAANLSISDTTLGGNTVYSPALSFGGALSASESTSVQRCSFVNNTATSGDSSGTSRGGAIAALFDLAQQLVVQQSQLSGSRAATGGAVFAKCLRDCVVSMSDSALLQNRATIDGGAFALADVAGIVERTLFQGNSAGNTGGGLFVVLSAQPFVARDCTFVQNAAVLGGGVQVASSAQLDVARSTFTGNTASYKGGALGIEGRATLQACRADHNSATVSGGAMAVSGQASLLQVNASDNSAGALGGALLATQNALLNGTELQLANNRVLRGGVGGAAGGSCVPSSSSGAMSGTSGGTSGTTSGPGWASGYPSAGGGAVAVTNSASMTLTTVWASNNTVLTGSNNGISSSTGSSSSVQNVWGGAGGTFLLDGQSNSTIMGATVLQSRAAIGGALAVLGARATLQQALLDSNEASVDGGAVYLQPSSDAMVQVGPARVQRNRAQRGGGMFWDLSGLTGISAATLANIQQTDTQAAGNCALVPDAAWPALVLANPGGAGGAVYYNLPPTPELALQLAPLVQRLNSSLRFDVGSGTAPLAAAASTSETTPMTTMTPAAPRATMDVVAGANVAVWGSNTATSAVRVTADWLQVQSAAGVPTIERLVVRDLANQPMTTLQQLSVFCVGDACDPTLPFLPVRNGTASGSLVHRAPLQRWYNASFALSSGASAVASPAAATVALLVAPCQPGAGLLGDGVCTVAPPGTFALNNTQPYQSCPEFVLCAGGTSVFVNDSYWPYIGPQQSFVLPLPCPYDFCLRDCQLVRDSAVCAAAAAARLAAPNALCALPPLPVNLTAQVCLYDVLDPALQSRFCRFDSHRTGVLCGQCEPGYAYWDRNCLLCDATVSGTERASAFVSRLVVLLLPTFLTHWVAQSGAGVASFKIFVFVYQISSLAVFPAEILDSIVGATVAGLRQFLNALSNTWSALLSAPVCPFDTSATGMVVVQLLQPLVKLLCVLGVWALQRLVLYVLNKALRRGSLLALRVFLALQRGADVRGLIRTLLVVSITQFEGVVETLFSVLGCEPHTQHVYLVPALRCDDPLQAVATVLVVLVSLLPLALLLFMLWLRARHRLQDERTQERYGVLYQEFSERFCFWEAWMLLRRVLLLGVFVLTVSRFDLLNAKLALSLLLGLLLVVQLAVRPFVLSLNNYLETFGLSSLLLLVAVNSQSTAADTRAVVSVVLLLLVAAVLWAPLLWNALSSARQFICGEGGATKPGGGGGTGTATTLGQADAVRRNADDLTERLLRDDERTEELHPL